MSAKIAQALHQVMSAVSYVQKTGNNKFHGYKYAGEADLLEKLRPAMLDAGLLLLPSIKGVSPIDEHGVTTVQMEYTLIHKDGDIWPHVICAAGQGGDKNKNGVGDKGLYKAITGANKYLLFKLFQIETGDDPEASDPPMPERRPNPHVTRASDILPQPTYDEHGEVIDNIPYPDPSSVKKLRVVDQRPIFEALQKEIHNTGSEAELSKWAAENKDRLGSLKPDWQDFLRGVYAEQLSGLRELARGDDNRMAG